MRLTRRVHGGAAQLDRLFGGLSVSIPLQPGTADDEAEEPELEEKASP